MEHASDHSRIRTQPLQARGKERFRLILNTAQDLFHERGIEAVTTNDIAVTAGVPIGSVYRYFPNKEAIIMALADKYVQEVDGLFVLITEQRRYTKIDWEEAVSLIIESWTNYARLNGTFGFLFFQITTPTLRPAVRERRQQLIASMAKLLRERCPTLSDTSVEICFRFMWAIKVLILSSEQGQEDIELYKEGVEIVAHYLEQTCNATRNV